MKQRYSYNSKVYTTSPATYSNTYRPAYRTSVRSTYNTTNRVSPVRYSTAYPVVRIDGGVTKPVASPVPVKSYTGNTIIKTVASPVPIRTYTGNVVTKTVASPVPVRNYAEYTEGTFVAPGLKFIRSERNEVQLPQEEQFIEGEVEGEFEVEGIYEHENEEFVGDAAPQEVPVEEVIEDGDAQEEEVIDKMDLTNRYPPCSEEEADAHAWVFREPNKPEKYFFKFPPVEDNEIRARVLHTGLCQSDVHTVNNKWGPCARPSCPGHEVIAEVTHVGGDVTDRNIGDIIGIGPFRDSCQDCDNCESGDDHLCLKMDFGLQNLYGFHFGGYCTAIQIKSHWTFLIPEGIDITSAPPLLCAGVTVFSPLSRHCKAGQKVGILGIGGLGHLGVQYAHKLGFHTVGFTRTESKVESIKALGADEVVVVDPDYEALKEHAGTFDAILNTIPVSDEKCFNQYLSLLKPRGSLLQVGIPDVNVPMSFGFFPLILGELNIIGSIVGGPKLNKQMLKFSAENDIQVQVEKYSFDQLPEAFDKLVNGRPKFRCVVNVEDYCKEKGL